VITPLYYFKRMFQIYSYMIAGLCLNSLLYNRLDFAVICMQLVLICGFIANVVVGVDIWRNENKLS